LRYTHSFYPSIKGNCGESRQLADVPSSSPPVIQASPSIFLNIKSTVGIEKKRWMPIRCSTRIVNYSIKLRYRSPTKYPQTSGLAMIVFDSFNGKRTGLSRHHEWFAAMGPPAHIRLTHSQVEPRKNITDVKPSL